MPAQPTRDLAVGVDVGGTKVLGVLWDSGSGRALATTYRMAEAAGPEVLDNIVAVASELLTRAGALPRAGAGEVAGVGLGLAGFVDLYGVVRRSANAPGLQGTDLPALLSARLGVAVVADNDANCVARAAVALRTPSPRNLVAVTLGTGIGGGLVVDGRLVRGARGFAGEPGHMVVDPCGPPCPCGQRGCWERYASGSGLTHLATEMFGAAAFPEGVRGEALMAAAAAGHGPATEVLHAFGGWIALGLANLVALLDPEVVVIGGGVVAEQGLVLPVVRRALADNPVVGDRDVPIEVAPGGPSAGAIGAALALL